jgi:uncharacterized protein YbjT (DUF2867 family)
MDTILVTGGTGHLGRDLVEQLVQQRRAVRVLARKPLAIPQVQWSTGNLATGEGIDAALEGVHTVVHAATFSPIARRGTVRPADLFTSPAYVDVDGTRRLLGAARRAGVAHFVHVSIVGLDDATLPYSRVKRAGEDLVRQSDLPWSVVRATPFFYLLGRVLENLRWVPVWPLPDAVFDPVDTSDMAAYLVECLDDGLRGVREQLGGPEMLSLVELAHQYQQARGWHQRIFPLRLSDATMRRMGLVAANGRRGKKTWAAWLREHETTAHSAPTHVSDVR